MQRAAVQITAQGSECCYCPVCVLHTYKFVLGFLEGLQFPRWQGLVFCEVAFCPLSAFGKGLCSHRPDGQSKENFVAYVHHFP